MITSADPIPENKNKAAADPGTVREGGTLGTFQFADNRQTTMVQRKLQAMMQPPQVVQRSEVVEPSQVMQQSEVVQRSEVVQPSQVVQRWEVVQRKALVQPSQVVQPSEVVQRKALVTDKLNIAGETHGESDHFRDPEDAYATVKGGGDYYTESQFAAAPSVFGTTRFGDSKELRAEMFMAIVAESAIPHFLEPFTRNVQPASLAAAASIDDAWNIARGADGPIIKYLGQIVQNLNLSTVANIKATKTAFERIIADLPTTALAAADTVIAAINQATTAFATVAGLPGNQIRSEDAVNHLRSDRMHSVATDNDGRIVGMKKGLWKVGNTHAVDMKAKRGLAPANIMTKAEFYKDFFPWFLKTFPAQEVEGILDAHVPKWQEYLPHDHPKYLPPVQQLVLD